MIFNGNDYAEPDPGELVQCPACEGEGTQDISKCCEAIIANGKCTDCMHDAEQMDCEACHGYSQVYKDQEAAASLYDELQMDLKREES